MTQVHKRFTDDQVRILLRGYCQGLLTRAAVQDMLADCKRSFFALLNACRLMRFSFLPLAWSPIG